LRFSRQLFDIALSLMRHYFSFQLSLPAAGFAIIAFLSLSMPL